MSNQELTDSYFDDLEHIPECDICEDSGCEVCDPAHHETHLLKWIAEGLMTLEEVVAMAELQASHLRERLESGWVLLHPVDTGYVRMYLPTTDTVPTDVKSD